MKRSISLVAQPEPAVGTAGDFTGWKDQNCFAFSNSALGSRTTGAVVLPASGCAAPLAIQVVRSAITSSASFSFGGMAVSGSPWRMPMISGLWSGLPATTAGLPDSPPVSMPAQVSRRSLPLSFLASALWQE